MADPIQVRNIHVTFCLFTYVTYDMYVIRLYDCQLRSLLKSQAFESEPKNKTQPTHFLFHMLDYIVLPYPKASAWVMCR